MHQQQTERLEELQQRWDRYRSRVLKELKEQEEAKCKRKKSVAQTARSTIPQGETRW